MYANQSKNSQALQTKMIPRQTLHACRSRSPPEEAHPSVWGACILGQPLAEASHQQTHRMPFNMVICLDERCEPGKLIVFNKQHQSTTLHTTIGTRLSGVVHGTNCEDQLCSLSSLLVRLLSTNSIIAPRVCRVPDGRYTFSTQLGDAGDFTLSVSEAFDRDRGFCACNVSDTLPMVNRRSNIVVIRVRPATAGSSQSSVAPDNSHCPAAPGDGRWVRAACSLSHETNSAFASQACEVHAQTDPSGDLLHHQPWLYVPHQSYRAPLRVLPLDFVKSDYWLHVEGDSTLLRGEKEDLAYLLSRGQPSR